MEFVAIYNSVLFLSKPSLALTISYPLVLNKVSIESCRHLRKTQNQKNVNKLLRLTASSFLSLWVESARWQDWET